VAKSLVILRAVFCAVTGAALAGSSLIFASPAQAQATVSRFSSTHTETFTAPLEGCLPQNLVGTVTLTETSHVQTVDTGNRVFTVHAVDEYDFHMELPNGIHVESGLNRDIITFVANPPHTVFNIVIQDFRTIYAADGSVLGTLSIHAGSHLTFTDLNGNGTPDPGEIAAEFEYFRLRCG
jgi:hypothetical protein